LEKFNISVPFLPKSVKKSVTRQFENNNWKTAIWKMDNWKMDNWKIDIWKLTFGKWKIFNVVWSWGVVRLPVNFKIAF